MSYHLEADDISYGDNYTLWLHETDESVLG